MVDETAGFWSYAHADNERESGRIIRLAEAIMAEFALLTGGELRLFVDRADLKWGDEWRARIDEALQSTTFFIPIITPTFFTRDECRKELLAFQTAANQLGLTELLLPIRYIPVRDLDPGSADPVKAIVAQMQYEPWDELRLLEEGSAEYRQGVNRLAQRLVDLAAEIELKPTSSTMPDASADETTTIEDDEDAPGLFDSLVLFQPAAEAWTAAISKFPAAFDEFTRPFVAATDEMNRANTERNAPALKLAILRRVAGEADGPSRNLENLGKEYAETLLRVDPGIRAYISIIGAVSHDSPDAEGARAAISQIRSLVTVSRDTMSKLASLSEAVRKNTGLSRDLRPVLRRVEGALRSVTDAQNVIEEWDRLAEATGF